MSVIQARICDRCRAVVDDGCYKFGDKDLCSACEAKFKEMAEGFFAESGSPIAILMDKMRGFTEREGQDAFDTTMGDPIAQIDEAHEALMEAASETEPEDPPKEDPPEEEEGKARLTPMQKNVIAQMKSFNGRAVSPEALAHSTKHSVGFVGKVLERLVSKGLVEQSGDGYVLTEVRSRK